MTDTATRVRAIIADVLCVDPEQTSPADTSLVDDLGAVFPEAPGAQLLESRVVTEPAAVFSVRPGCASSRLGQRTPFPGLFLAGDWTATGWPATMEGAVRSGNFAAAEVLRSWGMPAAPLAKVTAGSSPPR